MSPAAPPFRIAALVVKVLVSWPVLWAVMDPDLAGLKSKGLTARAVGYPLGTLMLPALWWLGRGAGRAAAPWLGCGPALWPADPARPGRQPARPLRLRDLVGRPGCTSVCTVALA